MQNITKVIAVIIGALTSILQIPVVQNALVVFLTAHPSISTIVGGVAAILALLHAPYGPPTPPAK